MKARSLEHHEILGMLGLTAKSAIASNDWAKYADNPIAFCTDVLGKRLTPDQSRIAEAVRDCSHVVVPSSHGAGKTSLAAWLVIWHVYAVGGLAVTSAPTLRQVKELLWGEIRKARGNLPGRHGILSLELSESARAFGFSSADANPNAFQGIHAERLLVVLDEACGISPDVADGAIACATGSGNKILQIGNPIRVDTPFHEACSDRANTIIRLPAWRHPNVSWAYEQHDDGCHRLKPEIAKAIADEQGGILPQHAWPAHFPRDQIPGAISIEWIERVRRTHGEGSPYWQSRVEAEFPIDTEWGVIPRTWFNAARARYDADPARWDAIAERFPWRHGIDVGDGGDPHGFASWRGPVLYACREMPCQGDREDLTRCAGEVRRLLDTRPGKANVDTVGVGSGVQSILKEAGYRAYPVNWGRSASDSSRYANLKAEQFWVLREAFRLGEVAIAPLGDSEDIARSDLAGICYEELSNGKVKIEDKTKTRKRLRRSPNIGDAIVYGYCQVHLRNPLTASKAGWKYL